MRTGRWQVIYNLPGCPSVTVGQIDRSIERDGQREPRVNGLQLCRDNLESLRGVCVCV
jgi:hypothetical protein